MAKDNKKEHPYGTTLLARDTEANRRMWKPEEIGVVPIDPNQCADDGSCPYYTDTKDAVEPEIGRTPIHFLIASFRDQLCPRTLHNLFRRAKYPERIYVRLLLQNEADSDLIDDADCWGRFCKDFNPNCDTYKHQVHTIRVDASRAKGPTDARSKLSAMIHYDYVQQESPEFQPVNPLDFCMQTDSHMDFSDDYDVKVIQMWHRCENNYAVLSTYVADIEYVMKIAMGLFSLKCLEFFHRQNNKDPKVVPNLCMVTFTGSIRNWGTKECTKLVRPKMTNMWGAGLSFHRCHAELNVPVDPYTDQVFDGEEGSRALRFFTHGYDIYTPDKVLVTHDYHTHQRNPIVHTWGGRKSRTANATDEWVWAEEIVRERPKVTTFGTPRVNMLLGIGTFDDSKIPEIQSIRSSRYGLGTKRTLQQAEEFAGLDLANKKMVANKCGNLKWVPYEESPHYGLGDVLARPLVPPNGGTRLLSHPDKLSTQTSSSSNTILSVVALISALGVLYHYRRRLFGRTKKDRHVV